MKTLAASEDAQSVIDRLKAIRCDDQARWGKMNAHQMLRHLADSMRVPLGEIRVSEAEVPHFQRIVLRWAALYVPVRWRRSFPTRPEIDQCRLNPTLTDFEADRETSILLVYRLCIANLEGKRTPILDH